MKHAPLRAGLARLFAALLLLLGSAPLLARDDGWATRARITARYLDRHWGVAGGWDGIEPWQRFVAADVLIDYRRRTGDRRWDRKITGAVRNRTGLSANDDDLWAVIASVHAWWIGRDPELLAYAAATYRHVVTTYWDDHCGGGLWWDRRRTYKNAITNELLIYASTQMFRATGQASYREWALRGWSWFAQSSMIGPDGLVNDGLDADCRNNGQPRFSYNQGVLIGGLNDLAGVTGNAHYDELAVRTAIAAIRGLSTPEGILHEPVDAIGSDGLLFKGIFAYHLGHLLESLPDGPERREIMAWVRQNAGAVWIQSASGRQPVSGDWAERSLQVGAAAQVSGLAVLLVAGDRPPLR
ncbi:glycoside hydrolase family 76 protein [Novosphingobium album (ex Hu et al. 2023)]|uniref:Glycoside hydrolase family 76 protein n=1 Tax=Novosphingobium album (ex Hu et al. 2023) TaxID=2930093 RepID=A0ABT0B6N6_9SPHN|nr:glycoside hydrolase family 76 protein [Novosphingobium album (ex Hu et al. 2023)]MCJ2180715.1 glycoside hydrolase family 76 protein [Novosphingobium album (ex Hu et al. 2023)]